MDDAYLADHVAVDSPRRGSPCVLATPCRSCMTSTLSPSCAPGPHQVEIRGPASGCGLSLPWNFGAAPKSNCQLHGALHFMDDVENGLIHARGMINL